MAIPVAIGKSKIFSFKTLVNITDAGKKQNKTKTILAKFLFFFFSILEDKIGHRKLS